MTQNIEPSPASMKEIIQCAGGQVCFVVTPTVNINGIFKQFNKVHTSHGKPGKVMKKYIFQAWKVMDLCLLDLLLQMSK